MRTFSNFLLFEGVLEDQPSDRRTVKQISDMLMNPTVKIVEEDCNTLLGNVVPVSYELIGKTELATDSPFTEDRLTELLGEGKYFVKIRDLHHCTSKEGICRRCYEAQNMVVSAPPVGSYVQLDSYINYQSDYLTTNVGGNTFPLSELEEDYDYVVVLKNGTALPDDQYYIESQILTLSEDVTVDDDITVHFFKETSEGFLGYMASSYSGGLLGIKPLSYLPTTLRYCLYEKLLDSDIVQIMRDELSTFPNVPSLFLEYADRCPDLLEKTLLLCYIYSLYANLN